ncbi:MAG: DUF1697 domain-containing protein [Planctomycetes bacterium]|nr:DUF1697 domain-containing protein [Planctomycetota bacterium]
MTRAIAFLRAVNVGGRVIRMADLAKSFERLGCSDVSTFIASGNVIFEHALRPGPTLVARIERALLAEYGFEVATFLRTPAEIAELLASGPFKDPQSAGAATQVIGFLAAAPSADARARVNALATSADRFRFAGREFFWSSRAKQSESKIDNKALERALGVATTLRSLSSLTKLSAKYPPKNPR